MGEVVVGGQVEADTYQVTKAGPRLRQLRVGNKAFMIIRAADSGEKHVPLSDEEVARRVLTDDNVLQLANLTLRVEQHYVAPQDMECAFADGQFYLVQTRPITTLATPSGEADKVLVTRLGTSSAVASGKVRVLSSPE